MDSHIVLEDTKTSADTPHSRETAVTDDGLTVFYVEPVGGHRGMHYYDFELCLALQSLGVDVVLLTCAETRHLAPPSSLTVEFPFQAIYGDAPRLFRGLRYLFGLAKIGLALFRRHVRLAHIHYPQVPALDYLFLQWMKLSGVCLVLTAHDVIPFDATPADLIWLHRIYQLADQIIVHAQSSRCVILQEFKLNPERVCVIPMGPYLRFADDGQHQQASAQKKLGLEPDRQVILFFGQIKNVKGLEYLVRAFDLVAEQLPSAHLVIAGPEWNESFDNYAALIDKLGLEDRVLTRIEYVPDSDVGIYFSAADVVALPYVESYQSAVLYMAYSFHKPVVASAVGGLQEAVEDGISGLLVSPKNVSQLADALLLLLQDLEKARQMGEMGRKLAESKYNWQDIARQTAEVYRRQLSDRNDPAEAEFSGQNDAC